MDNYFCDGQTHLFDFIEDPPQYYSINKKIRLIELFAGIGAQAKALERLGADFEHYRVVEFNKFAINSYNAIHKTNFEPSDITQINGADLGIEDKEHYTYILTYSFPCQDLSIAGKQKGMKKGSGTRSGLLWEVERLLKETDELPDVLLMENVSMVHAQQNEFDFKLWCNALEDLGYTNFWQDLNAKDYGVAQNRVRTFMVSILARNIRFDFPSPINLNKTIKDYLEENPDPKYYVHTEKSVKLMDELILRTEE